MFYITHFSSVCSFYLIPAVRFYYYNRAASPAQRRWAALRDPGCVACVGPGASRRPKIQRIASVNGADPVITGTLGTRAALTSGISLKGVHLCGNADFRGTCECPLEALVIVSDYSY